MSVQSNDIDCLLSLYDPAGFVDTRLLYRAHDVNTLRPRRNGCLLNLVLRFKTKSYRASLNLVSIRPI